MGVSKREFMVLLCDGCGREQIAEEGVSVDGYYLEAMQVQQGKNVGSDNIYACSDPCVEPAIRGSLIRESLPDKLKVQATRELWEGGRHYSTNPTMPVYDIRDVRRQIGTATDITPLDQEWKPYPR